MIAQAAAAGSAVHVALLTSGDGFRQDAERYYLALEVTPAEYMHLAYERQAETIRAMARLGVPAHQVHFLGFPDGGLDTLLLAAWDGEPWESPTTRARQVPYVNAYDPAQPYLGLALLEVLGRLTDQVRPALTIMPHPLDQHPDHWAAGAFATLAVARAASAGEPWAVQAQRWGYLVHWPAWPMPPAYRPDWPQMPPPQFSATGLTPWQEVALESRTVLDKREALMAYDSQVELIKPFLLAFARRSEVFHPDADLWLVNGRGRWLVPPMDRVTRWLKRDNVVRAVQLDWQPGGMRLEVRTAKPWQEAWRLRVSGHLLLAATVYDWWWPPAGKGEAPAGAEVTKGVTGAHVTWAEGWPASGGVMVGVQIWDGDRLIGRSPLRVVRWSGDGGGPSG